MTTGPMLPTAGLVVGTTAAFGGDLVTVRELT